MSVFSQHTGRAAPPPATLTLPPSAFAPGWDRRPKGDVCVGIAQVAVGDLERAKADAAREAWATLPKNEDAVARSGLMADMMIRWIVARGTTDPNDVAQPFELWAEAPEDMVKEALTPEGARAIFDAIERLAIETSPVMEEATLDDVGELFAFAFETFPRMPPEKAKRIRRLLKFCRNEIEPYVEV